MLRHRLITGALLIAAILGLCWLDDRFELVEAPRLVQQWFGALRWPPGSVLFAVVALLVGPLAGRELAALLRAQSIPAHAALLATGSAAAAYLLWAPQGVPWSAHLRGSFGLAALLTLALATGGIVLSRGQRVQGAVAGASALLAGIVWLGLFPGFLLALRSQWSAWVVLGVLITAKSADIGAYFTGRAIGRRKLIPWLSPGKTWEGLVGGILTAAVVGALLAALTALAPPAAGWISPTWGALCGAIFAVVGQLGDLGESLLKRGAGAKDSGRTLPGMGGVLDVLDSPLAVGPAAWFLLVVVGPR
jgi:phosphatidate cytidylyltransferase